LLEVLEVHRIEDKHIRIRWRIKIVSAVPLAAIDEVQLHIRLHLLPFTGDGSLKLL
jgi:hypothetical protein